MGLRSALQRLGPAALAAVLFVGCEGSSDPLPKPKPDGNVFIDDFGSGVSFQAFSGVPGAATIEVDTSVKYAGTASLKVNVPAGGWNGGAFPAETPRDLSSFNALTLRVRASRAVTLDVVGYGNDNTGTSLYEASRRAIPVTTDWTEVVLPVPLPAKLTSEKGLFYFAEGEGDDSPAFALWFDDVKFVTLPAERLGAAEPSIKAANLMLEVGDQTKKVEETNVAFAVDGAPVTILAMPSWFTFTSDHPEIAAVDTKGVLFAKAVGTATITAKLGDLPADGAVAVQVIEANTPAAAAPTPNRAAADVISLFSNAYTNAPVDTFGTDWSNASAGPRLTQLQLGGNDALKYADLSFVGIEFTGDHVVNATAMTHFHVDVWTHAATRFGVKLVDFGANGAFGGGDDTEFEKVYDASSTPALGHDRWVSLDVPLALPASAHVAQLILSADDATVYVDNLYFFKTDVTPPPAPEFPVVFGDDYASGVSFAEFGGSTNALSVDTSEKVEGTASLRIEVPASGYTGGTLKAAAAKDLSAYNALTFQVKASKAAHLNVAGFGNDAAGGVAHQVERAGGVDVGTTWKRVVIPLPVPAMLNAEVGLFHFAEGAEDVAYTLWIDDVKYESIPAAQIGTPTAAIANEPRSVSVGSTLTVNGASLIYPNTGADCVLAPIGLEFLGWESSNTAAATVDAGVVTGVAPGTAEITPTFGGVRGNGVTTVTVTALTNPAAAAPTPPARAAGDVVSLFSDAYAVHAVDHWTTTWDNTADPVDVDLGGGNLAKKYANLVFAGIEFTGANLVDASAMTHFHLDVWSADATELRVKLVDFGADGGWQQGGSPGTPNDDSEHELTFHPANGEWVSLDIPLADFTNMAARAHLAQLIISSSTATVFVDNVYFHK